MTEHDDPMAQGSRHSATEEGSAARDFWSPSPGSDAARRDGLKRQVEHAHVNEVGSILVGEALDRLALHARAGLKGKARVVYGPTGSGKSHLLERFISQPRFGSYDDAEANATIRPLVAVTAPEPCTLSALGRRLYRVLTGGGILQRTLREHDIWFRVATQMSGQKVRIVVIDEIHHVLIGRNQIEREKVAETLKGLMVGELSSLDGERQRKTVEFPPICLVLGGMPAIKEFIDSHDQLRRRCAFSRIEPVLEGAEGLQQIKAFLQLLGRIMPIAEGLDTPDMALRFRKASQGYLGFISHLVKQAAYLAVDQERDRIDPIEHLAEIYEEFSECGAQANPFLVGEPHRLSGIKLDNLVRMTRLRGKSRNSSENEEDEG
jgi:Bacterial TniB protein